jgi:predicted HTH domain antitoxin
MRTIGVRSLRENPGVLSKSAANGEYVLITNHNNPVSLSIPFDDALFRTGVNINIAIKLYEEGLLTIVKASKLAQMSVEAFLGQLSNLGVVVVDQTEDELASDLKNIE